MAFAVEDGSGVPAANSYATVASADTYFEDRGISTWVGSDDAKERALVRATDYVETRFGHRFIGAVQYPDAPQGLSFPRTGVLNPKTGADFVGVPEPLRRAVFEYALRALTAPLAPDPSYEANGLVANSVRRKVGPIETETTFKQAGAGATPPLFRPYPAADALLRPLLAPSGGSRVYR